jgi:putative flippase GtrA
LKLLKSLSRYTVGQAIAYGIDIGVFYLLVSVVELGILIAANVLGKVCAATFAFFYHRYLSFPEGTSKSQLRSVIFYVLMIFVNMMLTSLLLSILILFFPTRPVASKFFADVIGVLVTFLWMQTLVFPQRTAFLSSIATAIRYKARREEHSPGNRP